MTAPSRGPGLWAIIKTNFCLLYAGVLGVVSWFCWPETAEGWRFGIASIVCGLAAFALAVRCCGDIWRFISRDVAVSRFQREGRKPGSDGTAGDEAMRRSGMIR